MRIEALLIGALAVALAGPACAEEPPDAGDPRMAMPRIAEALKVALPYAADEKRFAAPENRAVLEQALAELAGSAQALEQHGLSQDPAFAFLSRALSRDSQEIERRFRAGRTEEARFLLGEVTEACVACHTRLPAPKASALGGQLFASVQPSELDPEGRAWLQTATRQFDAAMATYEELLASSLSPDDLDFQGVPTHYLRVATRVRDEMPRAAEALQRFQQRPDVPLYLDRLLEAWGTALRDLQSPVKPGKELATAREVESEGRRVRRFPADRTGLVHDLVVTSLLHRHLSRGAEPSDETAEALMLLGLAELRSDSMAWYAQGEFYLETAIRMAPKSEAARTAYAVLEEETLAGYGGSAGLALPEDVLDWLAELRALVEGEET